MQIAENESIAVLEPVRRKRVINAKVWAALAAALLHLVILAFVYRAQSAPILTASKKPGGELRVTLVAAVRKVVPQPPRPQVQPEIPKHVPHPNVLATHHISPRQVVVPDPKPEAMEVPVVTQSQPQPPAPAPSAAPEPHAAIPLPTPGDAGKSAHLNCDIPAPPYPQRARRLGHEGTVQLAVTIDAGGHITNAQVRKSSGYEELDDAAQQAMLSGHCDPLVQAGQAVSSTAVQPLSFHLDN
jgi:protein TonB